MRQKKKNGEEGLFSTKVLPPERRQKGVEVDIVQGPARFVFIENYRRWRVRKYGEYVKEGTEFLNILAEHELTRNRLKYLGQEIGAEKAEREVRLLTAQAEVRKLKKEEDEYEIQRQISMKKLLKELERLEGKDEGDAASKRIEREKIKLRTEGELEKIRREEIFQRRKELRAFHEEKEKEILKNKELSEKEMKDQLEDLEDFIQYQKENL